jgi:hypothetical protein
VHTDCHPFDCAQGRLNSLLTPRNDNRWDMSWARDLGQPPDIELLEHHRSIQLPVVDSTSTTAPHTLFPTLPRPDRSGGILGDDEVATVPLERYVPLTTESTLNTSGPSASLSLRSGRGCVRAWRRLSDSRSGRGVCTDCHPFDVVQGRLRSFLTPCNDNCWAMRWVRRLFNSDRPI